MPESPSLLFILSSIGVINSLMLTFYIFLVGKTQVQNRFLAALFLVLTIRIGKSVIFYFVEQAAYIDIYLQLGLSACLLIGPLLFFYTYSLIHNQIPRYWALQLIVYLSTITIICVQFPYMEYIDSWRNTFLPIIHLQWLIYLLFTGREIYNNRVLLTPKYKGYFNKKTWVISLFTGISLLWLAYVTTPICSYILGAVSFSFMVYFLIFLLLMGANKAESIGLRPKKYGGVKIQEAEARQLYEQVNNVLEQNYQNQDLNIDKVAEIMGVRKHKISQLLNDTYNVNFSSYLRKFRIDKVKNMIQSNEVFTLEAIGQECGFKAKSSYYAAFKKETGMTPLQFKKHIQG